MPALDTLIQSAESLPKIPLSAATDYYNKLSELKGFVDDKLVAEKNIHSMIGNNPLQMMFDNHTHHGAFMATVFSVGNYSLLAKTLPWVYRAYHNHGFAYDYFPLELTAWLQAVETYLAKEHQKSITTIYEWMLAQHQAVIELSGNEQITALPVDEKWLEQKNAFLSAALEGDHLTCLKLADECVKNSNDIESFYLQILQPALYEVGILWEKAEISVAQEHLAAAIVSRVMASVNLHIGPTRRNCGKIVIAASPNEYHEIGASMISDILENDGWKVAYLGANIPEEDLLNYLKDYQPDLLALSVTMAFNIEKARRITTAVKGDADLQKIKVLVGGRVFNDNPDLWKSIGADAFATNVTEALQVARQWQGS